MQITIGYNDRNYGGQDWRPEEYELTISISKNKQATAIRPQDAPFPHKKDTVRLLYKWDPSVKSNFYYSGEGAVYTGYIDMQFDEAEELSQLLLNLIQQAKLKQAPVSVTRPRRVP